MNFRKNSVLIIGCACALLLFLAAAVFLVKTQSTYSDNVNGLKSSENRLRVLNDRDPYPSSDNVVLAQENLVILKQKYMEIRDSLVRNQIVKETVEPARFAPLLEASVRGVRSRASAAGVEIPNTLSLGFTDYAAGKLPPADPVVMERLVIQLKAVQELCNLLIDAKIQSIDDMGRDIFEDKENVEDDDQVNRRRRRPASTHQQASATDQEAILGLPAVTSNKLYATERFTIEFTAWESSVWAALNNLVSSDVSFAVIDLSFANTKLNIGNPVDMRAKLSETAASMRSQPQAGYQSGNRGISEPTLESIPHEDRIVGGREPIKVKLVVDMYQYADDVEAQP